jgi:energy-coupling factor transporter ATP-binding protein EcfA2
MAQVSFEGVTKRFGDGAAVGILTLDIGDGELLVLLGSPGCGKTTALPLVAGLEEVSTISIGGRVVNETDPKDRDVAVKVGVGAFPKLSSSVKEGFEPGRSGDYISSKVPALDRTAAWVSQATWAACTGYLPVSKASAASAPVQNTTLSEYNERLGSS